MKLLKIRTRYLTKLRWTALWKLACEDLIISKKTSIVSLERTKRVTQKFSTRSVLQTIISIQPELEEELQPFLRYFERILTDSPTKTAKDRLQLDENAMQTELEMLMEQMADWRGQVWKDDKICTHRWFSNWNGWTHSGLQGFCWELVEKIRYFEMDTMSYRDLAGWFRPKTWLASEDPMRMILLWKARLLLSINPNVPSFQLRI